MLPPAGIRSNNTGRRQRLQQWQSLPAPRKWFRAKGRSLSERSVV